MNELEQLKKIVLEEGFDAGSRTILADYEATLSDLLMKEKAINNPVIREFYDYLQLQVETAELQLKTDRNLNDRKRDELFNKIDICNQFTGLFNGQAKDKLRESIQETLNLTKYA